MAVRSGGILSTHSFVSLGAYAVWRERAGERRRRPCSAGNHQNQGTGKGSPPGNRFVAAGMTAIGTPHSSSRPPPPLPSLSPPLPPSFPPLLLPFPPLPPSPLLPPPLLPPPPPPSSPPPSLSTPPPPPPPPPFSSNRALARTGPGLAISPWEAGHRFLWFPAYSPWPPTTPRSRGYPSTLRSTPSSAGDEARAARRVMITASSKSVRMCSPCN